MRALIAAAGLMLSTAVSGYDYSYDYGYGYPGYPFPLYESPRTAAELARIRDQLRAQRIQGAAEDRERAAEMDALRQQVNARYQVSAEQACYYRKTGGLELCDDLFDAGSPDHDHCAGLVRDRNPGCF